MNFKRLTENKDKPMKPRKLDVTQLGKLLVDHVTAEKPKPKKKAK